MNGGSTIGGEREGCNADPTNAGRRRRAGLAADGRCASIVAGRCTSAPPPPWARCARWRAPPPTSTTSMSRASCRTARCTRPSGMRIGHAGPAARGTGSDLGRRDAPGPAREADAVHRARPHRERRRSRTTAAVGFTVEATLQSLRWLAARYPADRPTAFDGEAPERPRTKVANRLIPVTRAPQSERRRRRSAVVQGQRRQPTAALRSAAIRLLAARFQA